jgi:hypothetical protein
VKAIPEGSHGSGTLQKRLWRLVSDLVRIGDWYKYGKRCVATGRIIARWQDGDAGHFRSYSKCNGMMKFDERNVFLQSKRSNGFGDKDDWDAFEEKVIFRGHDPEAFKKENIAHSMEQITISKIEEKMHDILGKMADLPEKPEYYARVLELGENSIDTRIK